MALFDSIISPSSAGVRGANTLTYSEAQRAGGRLGKLIDVVGSALGNILPETGLSERLEEAGGRAIAAESGQEAADIKLAERLKEDPSIRETLPQTALPESLRTITPSPTQPETTSIEDVISRFYPGWDPTAAKANFFDAFGGDINKLSEARGISTPTADGERATAASVTGALGEDVFTALGDNAQDLIDKYVREASGTTAELAAAIEKAAREAAENDYRDVVSALGVQKGEVKVLSKQQRERIDELKAKGEEELTDKEKSELAEIQKEETGFRGDVAEMKDTLGQSWRDMSLQVQRIMRARGVADSSFAAGQEAALLKDFNKGLRALAQTATSTLADFADAVVETNKFYTREKANLIDDASQQFQAVDNWERQQVQNIQAQENVARSQKLREINSAVLQARQLRAQTAQNIADKQLTLGLWLQQTQVQYQMAVAEAARGSVQSAQDKIKQMNELYKLTSAVISSPTSQLIVSKDEKGVVTGGTIHGNVPFSGESVSFSVTPDGIKQIETERAQEELKAATLPFLTGQATQPGILGSILR